jgi:hypothetical protein
MATVVFSPRASRVSGQAIGIDIIAATQAMPASYATGGLAVDLKADLGLSADPYMVICQVAGDTYRANYDYSTKKILLYALKNATAANIGLEVAAETNVSAVTVRLMVFAAA